MIGKIVQHYRILSELGRGGMGVVYAAEDTKLQRKVALKFLHRQDSTSVNERQLFREARAVAQLHHPHICPIYSLEESAGQTFLVLAYIEGQPLSRLIAAGTLTLPQILTLTSQVAHALDTAHRAGIIHRDIKPGNILVTADLQPYILDFGLASHHEQSTHSLDNKFGGTPAYVAPEQAQGHSVTPAADQYSLAATVYEMLTGRLPHAGGRPAEMLYRVVHEPPAPLEPARYPLPPHLEAALLRALSKAPKDRFPSVLDFAAALSGRSPGSSTLTQPFVTATQTIPLSTPLSRRRWPWLAAAALGATAAGYWQWSIRSDKARQTKRLAVLPLSLVGDNPQLSLLAEGFTESLTAQLTQIEDLPSRLSVVPATEVRARKVASAEEARRFYNVNLVLTGNAQMRGDRILFTLLLIDAEKLAQQGSRTLTFDSRNAVALQDAAIPAALRLLEISLPAAQQDNAVAGGTRSSSAYSSYLEGRGYLVRYDQTGNLDAAIVALERAVSEDPNYALALTALAEAYWRKAGNNVDPALREKAIATARQATRIAPQSVPAHTKLGEILGRFNFPAEAVAELQRALSLSPSNGEANRALANLLGEQGRDSEAQNAFEEALRRRPTDWLILADYGVFLIRRRRLEEAERALRSARELTPDNIIVLRLLGNVYLHQSRYQEASNTYTAALRYQPHGYTYNALGLALYYQHKFPAAAEALTEAVRLVPKQYQTYGNLATAERFVPARQTAAREHFLTACNLAEQLLLLNPGDHNTMANLAEYSAKLGDREKTLGWIEKIPSDLRRLYGDRLGLAYELIGERPKAIAMLVESKTSAASVEADPDLRGLSRDPAWRQALVKMKN